MPSSANKVQVFKARPRDFAPNMEVAACYLKTGSRHLFLLRSPNKPQGGRWGVPSGKVEASETPEQAVVREVYEEVGVSLNPKEMQRLGPVYTRYPDMDFVFHMFSYTCDESPTIRLSTEHQRHLWISIEEACQLPLVAGGVEAIHHYLVARQLPRIPRKEFYFIRHGETDVNANPAIKRVDYDLPLNTRGTEQAGAAREMVGRIPVQTVCCSPIQRAQQTKDIVTAGLDVQHVIDERLSECKATVWMKMVRLEKGSGYRSSSDIEQFLTRVTSGLAAALARPEPVLLVSHGGVHWALCYCLLPPQHPWKIKNCTLVHFRPIGLRDWQATVLS